MLNPGRVEDAAMEGHGEGKDSSKPIIGMPVYDSVDMLDVTGPYEMFTWAGFEVELVAAESRMHCFREGFRFEVLKTFAEASPDYAALWVPGGDPAALNVLMKDDTYLGFLRDKAAVTPLVASVCEGAMLLAAAGLLDGYEATTHWAFIPCLKHYQGVKVVEGYPRYHLDRDRLTGGGISSGLDESLRLIELLKGTEVAKQVQLTTQYYPCPPVGGAIPGTDECPLDTAGDNIPLCIPC
ncbi:DJ-1/PfpI family protein [Sphingomonas sp. QA11]|uniref:DJ-1/PfpI family protein n=1 Tax=Sphingomonas sp. QA11 TaxID=2950605 RepID=UPI002349FEB1|nr:DJ-1/PfpI family protein [Sphingomonas sp. QA11]WCM29414.1 DJ-1/PfpI family protein [Sphingomonas sp. QA11]